MFVSSPFDQSLYWNENKSEEEQRNIQHQKIKARSYFSVETVFCDSEKNRRKVVLLLVHHKQKQEPVLGVVAQVVPGDLSLSMKREKE